MTIENEKKDVAEGVTVPADDPVSVTATSSTSSASKQQILRGPPSVRSTIALVTAITGLVSAIAALHRDPPEVTAKESYVILQKAFGEQASEVAAVKREVFELRESFESYARAKEGPSNVTPVPSPPAAGAPPNFLAPVEVHVRPAPSSSAVSQVVVIPSARPPTTQRPLPDVSEVEHRAAAKK